MEVTPGYRVVVWNSDPNNRHVFGLPIARVERCIHLELVRCFCCRVVAVLRVRYLGRLAGD